MRFVNNLAAQRKQSNQQFPNFTFHRLHVDRSGGAWCPKQQIAESVNEFLEIDFSAESVISGIATQGRYGNGRGQEYAEAFRLEYWRPELSTWKPYRRWDGNEVSCEYTGQALIASFAIQFLSTFSAFTI